MSDFCIAGHSFHTLSVKLRERPQWVIWRAESRQDSSGQTKVTKIPWSPRSAYCASVKDPSTWGSFSEAVQALEDGRGDGIGFVFTTEDPYVGIDLDKCRDSATGDIEPWAQEIIAQLDSYTEVSPSGTGVHVIAIATLPAGGRRKGRIEMYDRNRYFCMTGLSIDEVPKSIEERQGEIKALHEKTFAPRTPNPMPSSPEHSPRKSGGELDDDALLERARRATNGDRFSQLFDDGNIAGYPSQSEADLALCARLAFWTNGDRAQMDRLFRCSKLMRPKWEESHSADGHTYGVMTIEQASAGATDGYQGDSRCNDRSRSGAQSGRTMAACRELPAIEFKGGALPAVVDQAEKALLKDPGPRIYQRGGMLVRVIRTESLVARRGMKRESGALIIHPIETPYLVERLTGAARWLKYDRRMNGLKAIDCPEKVAKVYMARQGSWQVAPLIGIIEAPTLRVDGSVLETPGYDEATGLFFDPGQCDFPRIPDHPSRQDASQALGELLDILKDFTFVDPHVDGLAAVAAILTALVRKSLPSAPLFVFRAPKMRSGKTLLADVVSMLATGRRCAVMSQALGLDRRNEERKRLLAILIEGDPVVNFDNCEHALEGAALCMAITQETIKDRILGASKTVTASTAVTFLATGNNLAISGDLVARVVPCDLDPLVERPEERVFDRDLYKFIPTNRGRLVNKALTILRAYHVAGMPEQEIPGWGGFDEWSRWIRGSLVWCGPGDPAAGRKRLEVLDPVKLCLRALLYGWYEALQDRAVTIAEVVAESEEHPDLRAVLLDQAGDTKGGIKTRSLGQFLRKHANRIEDGLRIERVGDRQGKALWKVGRIRESL